MVCNNMNIAIVIDAGIAMPVSCGFFNNQLDINIKNKILKQNGGMPRLPLIYVFSQATGYIGYKKWQLFDTSQFWRHYLPPP